MRILGAVIFVSIRCAARKSATALFQDIAKDIKASEGFLVVLVSPFGFQMGPQRCRGGSGESQGGSKGSWEVPEVS